MNTPSRPAARRRPAAWAPLSAATFVLLSAAAPLQAQRMSTPVEGREQTADQQVQHALNRLAFGPRPGDVERVRAMGVDSWIEQQLHPERIDDARMESWLKQFPTLTMTGEQFLAKYPPPGQQVARLAAAQQAAGARAGNRPADMAPRDVVQISPADSARLREQAREGQRAGAEIFTARAGRAVASERQLQEVLVDFWANHFSVFAGKPQSRYYIAEFEREAIRPHVLGNFRTLLGAVAKSPAMLTYLDQAQSVADSGQRTLEQPRNAVRNNPRGGQRALLDRTTVGQLIDRDRLPEQQKQRILALPPEQLQRVRDMTLLQAQQFLATLANNPRRPTGINENYARELMELHTLGVDGGYTQTDVEQLSRVLTGWTFTGSGQFAFNASRHDFGAKTVLGVQIPATSSTIGAAGINEGEMMLDVLINHPSTARFLATKMLKWLLTPEPTEVQINAIAGAYRATGGDIKRMVRAILNEGWVRDAPAKIKRPFHLVASGLRATNAAVNSAAGMTSQVRVLGQPLFQYETPDGYPDLVEYWVGNVTPRWAFATTLANSNTASSVVVDTAPYLAGTADAAIDKIQNDFFGGELALSTRERLLTYLRGGTFNATRVRETIALALSSHEFQWY